MDADINTEEDVQNQSLSVRQIMDVLDKAKTRLNLVFLDACRNNPYASRSFRSTERGLARVSAPSGTLISYATKPGSVAADGDGRNGLYTSKLLAQMDSNIQIELTLKQVVTAVKAASQGKQEPWMEGSIEGDFCFAGCGAGGGTQIASLEPVPTPASAQSRSKEQIEDDTWKVAEGANILDAYEAYLSTYPNGRYVGQAKIKIAVLKKRGTVASKPEPAVAVNKPEPAYVSQGGLTWMPITFLTKPWAEANSYCTNTAINGQSGWRLPTKDELSALHASGAINGQGWTLSLTWSSTPNGWGGHYYVVLDGGWVSAAPDSYEGNVVSCVR